MTLLIPPNSTLLCEGPASAAILTGRAETLAAPLESGTMVLVRRYRQLPLHCTDKAEVELTLGTGATIRQVQGDTIPEDWKFAASNIIETCRTQNQIVAIIGGPDTGKTTLATYLANRCVRSGLTATLIDSDIGQSDIGPPTTIGQMQITKALTELVCEHPGSLAFIGETTPSRASAKVCQEVANMCKTSKNRFNLTLLNTDGWVEGEDAKQYKLRLLEAATPDLCICLRTGEELQPIVTELSTLSINTNKVTVSNFTRLRSREERRYLREQYYARYFARSIVKFLTIEQTTVLGRYPLERGRLVAVYNSGNVMTGLGLVENIDPAKETLKLRVPQTTDITRLETSAISLENYGEIQGFEIV